MSVNTTDTGERKEMFGFTARHLKRTMISRSSPDACQRQQMKIETDGWYVSLEYGLNCSGSERPPQMGRMAPQGCRDRYQFKRTGPSNLGLPLMEQAMRKGELANRPQDAKLRLGIAYLMAGQKAKAIETFNTVGGRHGAVVAFVEPGLFPEHRIVFARHGLPDRDVHHAIKQVIGNLRRL